MDKRGKIKDKIVSEEKEIQWTISDFSSLNNPRGVPYRSPSFKVLDDSFFLQIYPNGDKRSSVGYTSVYVYRKNIGPPVKVAFTLAVKGAIREVTTVHVFTSTGTGFGSADFIMKPNVNKSGPKLLVNDAITILCRLKIELAARKMTDILSRKLTELDMLSNDFKELFANKETCDTTLKLGEKEYKVHRAVLMARSKVFSAMFHHDMLEKQTGVVSLPDCDSKYFEEFLEYVYTGQIKGFTSACACNLYTLADKYDSQALKRFCVQYMLQSLTVDNICDLAVLADKHDDQELLTSIQQFFNTNMVNIFKTNPWKLLLRNNASLAEKLLSKTN